MGAVPQYQCFICKECISDEENKLDPCSVTICSNFDKDVLDQRSQTFFCHYKCFKRVNNDDGVLYLESLGTEREFIEEKKEIEATLSDLCDLLYEKANEFGVWDRLFNFPIGKWIDLKSIIVEESELLDLLRKVEKQLNESIIITWTDDCFSEQRSRNVLWKVVMLATNSHYEWPQTLLIDLDWNHK